MKTINKKEYEKLVKKEKPTNEELYQMMNYEMKEIYQIKGKMICQKKVFG